MKGYVALRSLRVFGARIHIHWSALAVMGVIFLSALRTPILAVITILSYFSIIFVHEAGHAYFAKRLGYRPFDIYLAIVHGSCVYEAPYHRKHVAIVAWGGVTAQLLIALPLIVLSQTVDLHAVPGLGPIVAFLGYISIGIAVLNLAPSPALDGGKAWSLIPIWWAERRGRKKPIPAAKSPKRSDGDNVTQGPWKPWKD